MKIHEYQGKKLLDFFKINIPKSKVIFSLEQGIKSYIPEIQMLHGQKSL